LVRYYRRVIRQKIVESKWFKAFTSTPLIASLLKTYQSVTTITTKIHS